MITNTLESCCSIIEISDLYNIATEEFERALIWFLHENYDLDEKEYPTCIIATTNNHTQPRATKFLKEMRFKELPFYGRHQQCHLDNISKRIKYTSLWIRTSLPKGIITKARKIQNDYRKY